MTPAEFAADLEHRAAQAEAVGATAPLAATYRAIAAELANVNGLQPPPSAPVRLLKAKAVADRLGCSIRQVYALADTFPFTRRLRGSVRFDEQGLERWITNGRAA